MLVQMYHPLIPSTSTNPARVALSSVDDHAARGWLLVDPDVIPPAPETPYLTTAALVSQIVSGTGPVGTAQRAASVAAVEDADEVAPAGTWDFTAAVVLGIEGGTGGGGHTVRDIDDGVNLAQRPVLGFTGDGVVVTDDAPNGRTVVTIAGGGGGGAVVDATTTTKGIVELATATETTTGTDTTRAVTPAGVKAVADTKAGATHSHVVGDVTADGVPSSTTFLRGDGAWASPAAGSVASVNGKTGTVTLGPVDVGAVGRIVPTRRRLRFTVIAPGAIPKSMTDVATRSNAANGYYGGQVLRTTGRVANPLGKYYMLASPDHDPGQGGLYLFYAEAITGPWTAYNPTAAASPPPVFMETDPAKGQLEYPRAIWDDATRQFLVYVNRGIAGCVLYTSTDLITYEDQGYVLSGSGSYPGYFHPTRLGDGQWVGTSLCSSGNQTTRIPVYSYDGYTWRSHPNSMQLQLDFHGDAARNLAGPSGQVFLVDGQPWSMQALSLADTAGGAFADPVLYAGPVRSDLRAFLYPPDECQSVDTSGNVLHLGGGALFVDDDARIYYVFRTNDGGFSIAEGIVI